MPRELQRQSIHLFRYDLRYPRLKIAGTQFSIQIPMSVTSSHLLPPSTFRVHRQRMMVQLTELSHVRLVLRGQCSDSWLIVTIYPSFDSEYSSWHRLYFQTWLGTRAPDTPTGIDTR